LTNSDLAPQNTIVCLYNEPSLHKKQNSLNGINSATRLKMSSYTNLSNLRSASENRRTKPSGLTHSTSSASLHSNHHNQSGQLDSADEGENDENSIQKTVSRVYKTSLPQMRLINFDEPVGYNSGSNDLGVVWRMHCALAKRIYVAVVAGGGGGSVEPMVHGVPVVLKSFHLARKLFATVQHELSVIDDELQRHAIPSSGHFASIKYQICRANVIDICSPLVLIDEKVALQSLDASHLEAIVQIGLTFDLLIHFKDEIHAVRY
jgi:hypothetical protein